MFNNIARGREREGLVVFQPLLSMIVASVENNNYCLLDSKNSVPITETPLYLSRKCSHHCKSSLSSYDTGIVLHCKSSLSSYDTGIVLLRESQLHSSFNKHDIKASPGAHNCTHNLIYQQGLVVLV